MKYFFSAFFLCALLAISGRALAQAAPQPEKQKASTSAQPGPFTFRLIPAGNGTFGYEILQKGQPFIRQTSIPGQAGNRGFATKAQARKVAALVITKLNQGEMPPTVTPAELHRLGVSN